MNFRLAGKYSLKSTSHGKDNDRRLTIGKKKMTSVQILREILMNKNAIYMDMYLVQVPISKAAEYPQHSSKLVLD